MYVKNFKHWFKVKVGLDRSTSVTFCRSGEVRWVSFGVNIGSEIDGKGTSFTRPALILQATGTHVALVVPLTTKPKVGLGYFSLDYNGQKQHLCINQIRVISQKRVFARLFRISDTKLQLVKEAVKAFYGL